MHRSEFMREFYRISYRVRDLFWYFTLFLAIMWIIDLGVPHELAKYFTVLWIILALVWLAFPAWLNLHFRYAAWRFSQGLGFIINWLSSSWRPALLFVSAIASILFLRGLIINNYSGNMTVNSTSINLIATNTSHQLKDAVNPGFWPGAFAVKWIDLLSPDFWITVFLIAMLLSIASWAIGSRKSIILLQFSNQTGDEKLKSKIGRASCRERV